MLSGSFPGISYAQKDGKSLQLRSVSAKKESAQPKRKIAQSNAIRVLVSAYYKPERGQEDYATGSYRGDMRLNGGKKTSSGKIPQIGMVAVDPKVIPLGSQLYIPKLDLYAIAEDTGGDIKGHRVDVFTGSGDWGLEKAKKIGRQMAEIIVIKRAS